MNDEEEALLSMRLSRISSADIDTLISKGRSYGDSWKKRGGVGAFMMLARKWDRIETIVKKDGYDIFKTCGLNTEDIMDDLADLRRYLMLVESHVLETAADQLAANEDPLSANAFRRMAYEASKMESRNMGLFESNKLPAENSIADEFAAQSDTEYRASMRDGER